MRKGSVQDEAVEMEGGLALGSGSRAAAAPRGRSVHCENLILVGTTAFVELLQGGSVCFCAGVGRTSSLCESQAHAGTGVIMQSS